MSRIDALEILKQHAGALDAYLRDRFENQSPAPVRLMEAIRYSLGAGGKRVRPTLILETFDALNPGNAPRDAAMISAVAMELIHTFSLVHDDLPAMDNDDLRRGKPTNHKVFGEAMAILAGDAMVTLAFETIATQVSDPRLAIALVQALSHAAGPCGMIGGQVLDMAGETQTLTLDQLQHVHRLKTGALLVTSCRMGALCAGANDDQRDAATRFGSHMGLAFQIVDDLLDETATPEQLGKATQKDRGKGKNTYPRLLGLDGARAEADRQLQLAIDAISGLGDRSQRLIALAKFVVERKS
jgi:geranylgeranyl diphosphate synthase type II